MGFPYQHNGRAEPRRTPAPNTITAAAIRLGELTLSVAPPGDHDALFAAINVLGLTIKFHADYNISKPLAECGFITSRGRFVNRRLALEVAKTAKQLTKEPGNPGELYCEDIW